MHMMNSAKDAKVNSKKNKGLPEITDYLADYVLLNKKMISVWQLFLWMVHVLARYQK